MAKKNNVFMNWVSNKVIHEAKAGEKTFYNVSIPVATSINGFGSVSVSKGQVMAATKKDGTVSDGFKNILLGAEDGVRKVSIKTDAGYETIEMTNREIADAVAASRAAYRATVKAEANG